MALNRYFGVLSSFITTSALFASVVNAQNHEDVKFDVLDYVDPLIGTSNGGKRRQSFLLSTFSSLNV